MGRELVSSSSFLNEPNKEGGERTDLLSSPYPYTAVFYERFPYYLSIGMTEEQYWDKDSTLAIYYRKAEQLRIERDNQLAWLQGMYVYDAIARLSPILRSFGKKGTKPEPYVDQPYPVSQSDSDKAEEKREKEQMNKAKRFMDTFAVKTNLAISERERSVENADNRRAFD